MSNPLAASKKLMQNYLSDLMHDEEEIKADPAPTSVAEKEKLDKLLQQVNVSNKIDAKQLDQVTTVRSEDKKDFKRTSVDLKEELVTQKSQGGIQTSSLKSYREGAFQAMFFDVAGLTVAVPLIELGGIHNLESTTSLMGKPSWFTGVMLHRDEKINVVDTAQWVMPEKCDDKLMAELDYKFIIMLNKSAWGLSAESLVDTVTLQQEDVKWLESTDKRPWLAGLVKDRMCALLDVDSLIKMLDQGANIKTN